MNDNEFKLRESGLLKKVKLKTPGARRIMRIIILMILMIIVLLILLCCNGGSRNAKSDAETTVVNGTEETSAVTYINEDGQTVTRYVVIDGKDNGKSGENIAVEELSPSDYHEGNTNSNKNSLEKNQVKNVSYGDNEAIFYEEDWNYNNKETSAQSALAENKAEQTEKPTKQNEGEADKEKTTEKKTENATEQKTEKVTEEETTTKKVVKPGDDGWTPIVKP